MYRAITIYRCRFYFCFRKFIEYNYRQLYTTGVIFIIFYLFRISHKAKRSAPGINKIIKPGFICGHISKRIRNNIIEKFLKYRMCCCLVCYFQIWTSFLCFYIIICLICKKFSYIRTVWLIARKKILRPFTSFTSCVFGGHFYIKYRKIYINRGLHK